MSLGDVIQDITEQVQTEAALRESEERYRSLYSLVRLMVDNVEDLLWAKDMEKRFVFTNKAICEKLLQAKDIDEPIGKTDMFFANRERASHPENPQWHTFGENCTDSDSVIMESKKQGCFDEFGNVRGKYLHLQVFKAPIWDEQGRMIGTVGVGRDVTREKLLETECKKMEEVLQERNRALKESQEYSRNVIDSSLDMIITVDLDRRIVAFNKAAQGIFGYGQEEVVGQPIDLLYADPQEGRAVHDTTVEKGSCRQEVLNKRKDDQTFPALISASLLRDTEGELVGVMGVSRDITEQKRAERQIQEALADKEMLLREVNHRVGNNLTAIAGMLTLAQQELRDADPTAYQSTIEDLMQRVTSLATAHNMLSASEWSPVRLNELAGKIINESLRILPPRKQVSVSVTPSDVRVVPDLAHNLALVINELATNTVKYALKERTAVHIAVSITQDGDDITVTFRDDGPGYPEDVLRLGRHGVGLDFIETVIRRSLRGELELRNDDGAVTVMRFTRDV